MTTRITIRLFLAQTNSKTGCHWVHHGTIYRLGWGKDPPGTPRVLDQLRRFGDTHLVSHFRNILRNTPPSEQIAITSPHRNPTLLTTVMLETVTPSFDDHEEIVFVVDDAPSTPVSSTQPRTDIQDNDVNVMPPTSDLSLLPSPPSHIYPPATITDNFISEQPVVSSTSSDAISMMSRVSQDPEGIRPIIAAAATAATAVNRPSNIRLSTTPFTNSRGPAGSIIGSIERQVKRQNQQIDAVIQEIRPSRPDPLIATEIYSIVSGMTNPTMPPPSPSLLSFLPSLDFTLLTEWQGNLLPSDVKLLHKNRIHRGKYPPN